MCCRSDTWLSLSLLTKARYGRLSISGTVLSKRKIKQLVDDGYVRGWDDPRLYTLPALRRRGVPPGAILSFVNELGVTKATTNIEIKRFETSVRRYLEVTVPRLMLVLDPIKVVIDDLPEDHVEMLEMPFSKEPTQGVSGASASPIYVAHGHRLTLCSSAGSYCSVHQDYLY